jgi:hypothetical protein
MTAFNAVRFRVKPGREHEKTWNLSQDNEG